MPNLIFNPTAKRYFLNGVTDAAVGQLTNLRWQYQSGAWSTGSPYYAAPFWEHVDPADTVTQGQLGAFAWNYKSSFTTKGLHGTGVDAIQFPQHETRKPMDFQVGGVQLATRQRATLLADPMGLGKSLQAIGIANVRQPQRVLISCPAFLTLNWADELVKWATYAMPITILDRPRKNIPDRGFVILPYSRAMSYWSRLMSAGRWGLTILDEIHYLKGEPGTARIKPYFGEAENPGVVHASDQVIGLTGTPIPNSPHEMFNVLSCFRPDIMGQVDRNRFKEMYCVRKPSGKFSKKVRWGGGQYTAALNAELRASGLMVRRNKSEVLSQLPPKVMNVVQLSANAEVKELVSQEADYFEMLQMRMFGGVKVQQMIGHIASIRAELGVKKAPKIAEYAQSMLENGENRIVIFMWHTAAINAVADLLRKRTNAKVHILDGKVSVTDRFARVREFQSDSAMPQIIVGQIKAAGVGLTMTRASQMIMGELSWSPADNEQAIDRIHRISQLKQVTAHILTYPHSCDVRVIKSNAEKALVAEDVLDRDLMKEFEIIENVYEIDH